MSATRFSGLIDEIGMRRLVSSKPSLTGPERERRGTALPSYVDPIGQIARQGIQAFRPQQRDEILVGKECP